MILKIEGHLEVHNAHVYAFTFLIHVNEVKPIREAGPLEYKAMLAIRVNAAEHHVLVCGLPDQTLLRFIDNTGETKWPAVPHIPNVTLHTMWNLFSFL